MSGPALKMLDSHRSIHEGAYHEASELTEILLKLHIEQKSEQSIEVANALLESWKTRTLAHAQSEEEGLYQEKMKESPEMEKAVIGLIRDHEIMRVMAKEIEEKLEEKKVTDEMIYLFRSLLIMVKIHSNEEEKYLLL
ncbi:hypothetical protein ACFSO7_03395 [Bacillus sp. CGMCC 1.16607]|uniref:hypothetical protein n=1 Tax=Bacillus sp. CGMCC 1.16607 TaxID=3351842 RepID=UPI003640F263